MKAFEKTSKPPSGGVTGRVCVCVRACVGPIQCIPQLCDQFDPVGVQVCIGGDEKEEQQPPSSFGLVDLHD